MVLLHTGGNQGKIGMKSYIDEFSYFPKLCKILYVHNIMIYYVNYIAERPTKREVLTQLAPIDASWRSIGNGLRVSFNFLAGLAEANMSNQIQLSHVIERWLKIDGQGGGAPITWNTILDVIRGPLVQNKTLAREIYEYLKQESSVQQSGKCIWNYFNYQYTIRGTSNINYKSILYGA